MDKSWISMPRNTPQYMEGLETFLDFAFAHNHGLEVILCPCPKCGFKKWLKRNDVYDHLIKKSFPAGYKIWFRHGESHGETSTGTTVVGEQEPHFVQEPQSEPTNAMHDLLNDAFGVLSEHGLNEGIDAGDPITEDQTTIPDVRQEPHDDPRDFCQLLKDEEEALYDGCTKFSKLSFLLRLYHIKYMYKISDKAMSKIIELLHEAFDFAKIPATGYAAKKVIKGLGLTYTKIDACPNDCMLYWGNAIDEKSCSVCTLSRYKQTKHGGDVAIAGKKKQPAKVFRYFPLIPRLQRLFMSSKTAEDMTWHSKEKSNDGMARHPRDAEAWKDFDFKYPEFASDPRNVRLALATDGFNPFGSMSSNYSIWPIVLIPYNTPPWLGMKQTSFILSSIIPGKKMVGNDIDIYLKPLILELQKLWEGVETYDAAKKETFKMRAALTWTISDFPGLGTLSGWNTYTGLACPSCNFDSLTLRLSHSKKWCFMGSRRFLPKGHRFRLQKLRFNGKVEDRDPPKLLSGSEILKQLEHIKVTFGKSKETVSGRKRNRGSSSVDVDGPQQWRKKSIFFELPYWEFNLLRHNLDVMHIEKNVCDNILYTLLNDKDKRKDHLNARKDLVALRMRKELWPMDDGKTCPAALFTMEKAEIDVMLSTLKSITVPDGYSSNISRCVDLAQRKMFGLKSHDSHVLLHEFLPLAIRNVLPTEVSSVLVEFCSCFKQLCSKVVNISQLESLQQRIVLALCHMEMLFPPSFFTVMVHLVVHLVEEVRLGGPVHYRWMYPIERFLGKLKSFVGNRAQPEGSIAESWRLEEMFTFTSLYLDDNIETRFNRRRRVNDQVEVETNVSTMFPRLGQSIGEGSFFKLTMTEKLQAHRHVLMNCQQAERFLEEFRLHTKRRLRDRTRSATEIQKAVHRGFVDWFRGRILNDGVESHSADLITLARGPLEIARKFTAHDINGYRFRTLDREKSLKTQNSGVYCGLGTRSYASSADNRPVEGIVPYYGKLVEIIELNYYGTYFVTLFKCQWANTTNPRYVRKDVLGFTLVNFSHLIHTGERDDDEPYIQASEARMVYYVEDEVDKGWSIPVHLKPRDLFDMGEDGGETYECETFQSQDLPVVDEIPNVDVSRPGLVVDFE